MYLEDFPITKVYNFIFNGGISDDEGVFKERKCKQI